MINPLDFTGKTVLVTGGGKGTHQVYVAGIPHHRLKNTDVVEHLVEMIEAKAAEIEAAKARDQKADLLPQSKVS